MGHKVSTISEAMNCISSSPATTVRWRHRAALFLAMTLAVTTVDSFVSPSPYVVAASSPPHRQSIPAPSVAAVGIDTSISAPGIVWKMPWRRRNKQQEEYEQAKQEFASTYASVESLRRTFGENRNKLWGDLDVTTCRRLYKTLLPRALLELYRLGLSEKDLAPLAYQARVAAKLYARERCIVPGRLFAQGFDGLRQWRKYGKFQVAGMSYDQVWNKYESQILEDGDLEEQDVTAKICLKILERSCQTNQGVDRLFLKGAEADAQEQNQDIDNLTQQLEKDVKAILDQSENANRNNMTAQRVSALRMVVRAKRRLERLQNSMDNEQNDEQKQQEEEAPWNHRVNKMDNRPKPWLNRSRPNRI